MVENIRGSANPTLLTLPTTFASQSWVTLHQLDHRSVSFDLSANGKPLACRISRLLVVQHVRLGTSHTAYAKVLADFPDQALDVGILGELSF